MIIINIALYAIHRYFVLYLQNLNDIFLILQIFKILQNWRS